MSEPVTALTEELRSGRTENIARYLNIIQPLYADIIRWIGELSA
jgi:hypothetical protein